MNKKPLIGLNMSLSSSGAYGRPALSVPLAYTDAVAGAGGLPVCLPLSMDRDALCRISEILDGMVFIGGADYRPDNFGGHEQPEDELVLEPQDRFDVALAKMILEETALPVLGICGGCQLINIALGGALVQDIPTEWPAPEGAPAIPHSGRDRKDVSGTVFRHPVALEAGSLVACVVDAPPGEAFLTNSFHHQAIHPQRLGRHLRASAWTADGIVEAVEPAIDSPWAASGRFVLGVQWHPERLQDEALHRNVFLALIEVSKRK